MSDEFYVDPDEPVPPDEPLLSEGGDPQVFLDHVDEIAAEPLHTTGKPASPEAVEEVKRIIAKGGRIAKARLVRASDLLPPGADLDVGDYEPNPEGGVLYKSFPILPHEEWPEKHEQMHGNQKKRFYVRSSGGVVGMVPWDGSQVVWPWEVAWTQDLYRPEVTSFLKEEKKKK